MFFKYEIIYSILFSYGCFQKELDLIMNASVLHCCFFHVSLGYIKFCKA